MMYTDTGTVQGAGGTLLLQLSAVLQYIRSYLSCVHITAAVYICTHSRVNPYLYI